MNTNTIALTGLLALALAPTSLVARDRIWGLHFDFHAGPAKPGETQVAIGETLKESDIAEICDLLKPDFLQVDCKGHPGWTSYPSKLGNAMPKFAGDPLRTWRKVTAAKGVPLYMHYSGIYDVRYCRNNPEEATMDAEGRRTDSVKPDGRYADDLLIPQLCELAGDYGVDGVWVDGDCWAVKCDYDPKAVAAFEKATGIDLKGAVPKKLGDAHFGEFREYFRGLYRRYLNRYVDAVHAKYPKFRICSNWSYSLYRPDDLDANVDFVSGDLASMDSFYSSRLAGRLNARHGKPWDLMSWEFRYDWKPGSAYVPKHPVQLMQEAASVISLGGGFQVYITQKRDGSPRMDRIRAMKPVADFVRARAPYCYGGDVRRELALLLPVSSQYAQNTAPFACAGQYCTGGILNLLCDAGRSVRVATETEMTPEKIGQWKVIVIPQLYCELPKATTDSIAAWTKAGGRLVLAGPETCRFFAKAGFPSAANDDLFTHQRLFTTDGGKTSGSFQWSATLADDSGEVLARTVEGGKPFAAVRPFGRGQVAVLPAEVGYSYENSGEHHHRLLVNAMLDRLYEPTVRVVSAKGLVEATALEKDGRLFVQLVNANGQHHNVRTFTEDFLPPALDVRVRVRLPAEPAELVLWPAGRKLDFTWRDGAAEFALPRLDLHDIVEVRCAGVSERIDDARAYFDGDMHKIAEREVLAGGRKVSVAEYERQSQRIFVLKRTDAAATPAAETFSLAALKVRLPHSDYRCVDLETGCVGRLQGDTVRLGKAPVMLAANEQVPRRIAWTEMSPVEIVDAWYRPHVKFNMWIGDRAPIKLVREDEPWAKMKTTDFLPCIDRFGQFKYREWPGKTHSDAELKAAADAEEKDLAAHPGPADRNRYGGWTKGPQLKATGRFRTEKTDGKWWLVDPEGRLFWSFGAVRVTPSSALTPLNGNPRTPKCGVAMADRDCLFEGLPAEGAPEAQFYGTYDDLLLPFYLKRGETRRYDHSAANLYRKYGTDWFAKFADSCHRRLRSWGANTIANSSDLRICLQDRTPYAERVECQSRPIAGSWGQWSKFRDPFDPSFAEGVAKALAAHGREAHDPWCIGFFIDNEIQWGGSDTDLARWTLRSPDDQPAKVAFAKRLAAKGIDLKRGDKVPDAELRAFTAVIVEEYFKRTRAAVKAFDPGLLYLGCRFACHAPAWAIGPCAKYCDVVSYNIYDFSLDGWRLPQDLDAPVMVGEFHFGAHDRGLFGSGLINAKSQAGRAAAIRKYVASALANPQVVGVHWHQFSDQSVTGRFDGEFFQVGWTDVCDRPYPETRAALREVGYPMYEIRAGVARR